MQHSLNLMTNLLALFDFGFAQVIGRLKIQPELSRSINGCSKAQGHVGTDAVRCLTMSFTVGAETCSALLATRLVTRRSALERGHVDHEAVFHIALEHAFVGLVDLVHGDHLDVRDDLMLGAEIQHFLGFSDASNQ
jgi:hypothetical protein